MILYAKFELGDIKDVIADSDSSRCAEQLFLFEFFMNPRNNGDIRVLVVFFTYLVFCQRPLTKKYKSETLITKLTLIKTTN